MSSGFGMCGLGCVEGHSFLFLVCGAFSLMKGLEFCQMLFPNLLGWPCDFYPLFCSCGDAVLDVCAKPSLHPSNKPHLLSVSCPIFSMCCCIQFANPYLSRMLSDENNFLVSLPGFGVRVTLASKNEFRNVPISSIFWTDLRRIGADFPLTVS